MRFMRRLAGILLAVVGGVGIVMSVIAVAATWSTARSLTRDAPQAIGRLETVGRMVGTHGESAAEVIDATRGRLSSIQATVEELSRSPEDRQAPVLDRLDAEVIERLERAEEFVQSLQTSLDGAGRAMMMLESIPFIGLQPRRSPEAGESDMQSLSSNLADASQSLSQMLSVLSSLRTRRTADPAEVERLRTALQDVDGKLVEVQSELSRFSTHATALVDQLSFVRSRSNDWIKQSAVVCTVFLICFGFSQLHLLIQAWRMIRRHSPSTAIAVTASP